jgi:hypothetical protein
VKEAGLVGKPEDWRNLRIPRRRRMRRIIKGWCSRSGVNRHVLD